MKKVRYVSMYMFMLMLMLMLMLMFMLRFMFKYTFTLTFTCVNVLDQNKDDNVFRCSCKKEATKL